MSEIYRRQLLAGVTTSAIMSLFPNPPSLRAQGWEVAALWVGEKLLEGAVAYVGGRLMQSALGGATIIDVRTWIREAVAELEAFVDTKFTELLMDQLTTDVEGIQNNLAEYASLKPPKRKENKFLIEAADVKTASLIPLALRHEETLQIFFAAVAFRFFTVMALYELDRDRAHIFSQKPFVDEWLRAAGVTYKKILGRLSPDYRIKIECGDDPGYWEGGAPDEGGREVVPPYSFCNVTLDGRGVGDQFSGENRSVALQQAQAFVAARLRPATDQQFTLFQKSSLNAFSLLVDCYEKMCARVGGSYSLPNDLGFQIPSPSVEKHEQDERIIVGAGYVIVPQ